MFQVVRFLALVLGLGGLWGMAPASAQPAVVVELYTSQGCSSCPPADELLTKLSERQEVIALALHVDYWDYIGWKDHFAQAKFTQRQRAYAREAGSRMIYTPQMVIGGRDHVIGTRPMEVAMSVEKLLREAGRVELRAKRQDGIVQIAAEVPAETLGELLVQLVQYTPEETVSISRGENRGKTITYTNIVTSWEQLTRWSAEAPLSLEAPIPGEGPLAVILQQPGPGPIVAAYHLN